MDIATVIVLLEKNVHVDYDYYFNTKNDPL